MGNMIQNDRKPSDLTQTEVGKWNRINGRFAHLDINGNVAPDIVVLTHDKGRIVDGILQSHPLFEQVKARFQKAHDDLIALYMANSNPVLHEQLAYYATMDLCATRMMAIQDEVNSGRLSVPAEPEKSTAAMYMIIE